MYVNILSRTNLTLYLFKVPASWICAEGSHSSSDCGMSWLTDTIEDFAFKPAFRLSCEAVFAERKGTDQFVDYEFKDYKGG